MSDSPIDFLLSRRSLKFVQAPGPDDDELDLILQTAMRAPDHGRLRPWRFKIIRNEAAQVLADLAINAIKTEGLDFPPKRKRARVAGSVRCRC